MFRSLASPSSRTMRTVHARPFSLSASRRVDQYPNDLSTNSKTKTDRYPDDKHATEKVKEGDTNNVQEANAKHAMNARDEGGGGNATGGKDVAGAKSKTKKEFPEAPDMIGMQDERGGKGA